jgi:hypothetical protein
MERREGLTHGPIDRHTDLGALATPVGVPCPKC